MEHVNKVVESLKSNGLDAEVYDQVAVEPTDISFKQGSLFASEGKFDGFVSVGGGSVMDTCKASNLYSCYPADFLDYVNAPIGKAVPVPGILKPHIACPTTFGTASECTAIAIFDLLGMEAKTGIVSKSKMAIAVHSLAVPKVVGQAMCGLSIPGTGTALPIGAFT
jgi:alcohol dehydrogenase class IV